MKGKVTTATLRSQKEKKEKITVLTAYDHLLAKSLDEAGVDIVLVGDSVGNVLLGYENTLPVTMEEMLHHTKAVCRAVKRAMVVADMPFLSYQIDPEAGVYNAGRFIKEAGANAVKVEGDVFLDTIERMVATGIPVMGHLGFTPQLLNVIGGYKVQGKTADKAKAIIESAKTLEDAGIFSLVLEMVPQEVAKKIAEALKIPVIGIGAGPHCDGQVLVTHDMLGFFEEPPKFVKKYAFLGQEIKKAVGSYIADVRKGSFPKEEHSF